MAFSHPSRIIAFGLGVFLLAVACSLPAFAAGGNTNVTFPAVVTDSNTTNNTLPVTSTGNNGNDGLPAIEWQHVYNRPYSDVGYNAVETPGGYLVLGVTKSHGNGSYDAWLLKIDPQGNELWNRTYGGTGGDWFYGLIPTKDGNYVMAGALGSGTAGGFDIWLLKVNGNGDILWSKTFGGPNYDVGFSVAEMGDGGYAVTGYSVGANSDYDVAIIRTDHDGNLVWRYTYPFGAQDWGKSIVASSDGGIVVAGWTKATSSSSAKAFLLKTDGNGTRQWDGVYGTAGGDTYGYGVIKTVDGGYILGGYTTAGDEGGVDVYAVKVDRDGGKLWEKVTGLAKDDYGFNAYQLSDGLVFGGYSSSFDPALWKLYLVRTDNDGNILGYQSYGPEGTSVKGGLSLLTSDGGFLFVGNTNEYGSGNDDVFVLKLGGTSVAPAPSEDIVAKAAVPVAAVVAGTGLSFLALFMGRIFDYLSALFGKIWDGINDFLGSLLKIPLVDALYKLIYGYFKTYVKGMIFGRINKIKVANATDRAPFWAGFSATELWVLAVSAALLGLAYIFAKKLNLQLDTLVLYIFIAGLVTSFHDLAHRYYAYKYKSVAEYKFWGFGTLVMFLTALGLGVTYAVPARTIINKSDAMSVKEQAIVYISGPLVSGILAFAFLLLVPFGGTLRTIGLLGVSMNLLSAVYSLTPFNPMDGNKVYRWKKALWAFTFVPLLLLYLGITIFVV
jgi:Zn-dependent protease